MYFFFEYILGLGNKTLENESSYEVKKCTINDVVEKYSQ